ncbi:uncharacterized protein LOC132279852 isoform X2 [Cornus florida]|uniref:uncharacterized protein LOC132279852 isoform X2 n=1 Tax=Cornus florida TaxID=4283 RepID=UPI0028976BBF|nr:uncharacterized protein LOC132279852 isoform X2 [Cornus florida]
MDSRDSSSSSSSTPANREASAADDDGALSVTAALAKDAGLSFQSGKFAECIDVLKQLLQKKEDDPKIRHNIAITEYFQDGCLYPKKLLEVLNNVKAVIWFHLHEYSKAFSVLESLYQKIEPIDEATALHICLLFLDVALASHNPWKFVDIINYLEKAFWVNNLISQGDNGSSAQQQSLNLVAKPSSLPSNSTATDAFNSDSISNASASENPLSRTLSEETLEYVTFLSTLDNSGQNRARPSGLHSSNDLSRTPADQSISAIDLRLKLHLYKVRFLLLTKNLKAAKREVKMAMNMARGKDSSIALLLKSQLEYARGNYRKAVKVLMASSNRTEVGISSIYNNNLGCIFYRLGKFHTSAVFFSKALSNSSSLRKEKPLKLSNFSQDKSLHIIYNCGVQYLACGKPIFAARCFHKASVIFYNRPLLWLRIAECCLMALEKGLLKSSVAQSDRSEVKVHVIGKGKWRHLVTENGISRNGQVDFVGRDNLLLCDDRQPNLSVSLAHQCLFNALHLLNCSESNYQESDTSSSPALEENESREAASSKISNYISVSGESKAINLTVQVSANGDVKEQKGGICLNATLKNSILDYENSCRRDNQMIKQALLADLAYVELELGNPLKALSTASSLLKLQECSRIYVFLGHVYAAESLCLLNRPKEAAEHLLIYLSGGDNIELPYSEDDSKQVLLEKALDCEELNVGAMTAKNSSLDESQGVALLKPEEARGILYANLATMFAIQGDLEQAQRFVMQALSIIPNSPEAILTAIYVDLMLGKTKEALEKFRQCSHIRFLPASSKLSSSC